MLIATLQASNLDAHNLGASSNADFGDIQTADKVRRFFVLPWKFEIDA